MKSQLALFEASISSAVLAALILLLTNTLYTAPTINGAYNFNYGNLLYDFTNAFYRNATLSSCFISGNHTCELDSIKTLKSLYDMNYVEFSLGDSKVSYGSGLLCRRSARECFPIRKDGSFLIACVYACGA